MVTLSANEAKTHFGDMLLKAQRSPVHISKNGKPVAVVVSADEYKIIEELKLQILQLSASRVKSEMPAVKLADDKALFDALDSGAA